MADMFGHTPPRPKRGTPEVIQGACKRMLDDVCQWWGAERFKPDAVLTDLVLCFKEDGYDFARALDERRNWPCDAGLVDILDNAATAASIVHGQLVKDWVAQNHIDCPFKLGDVVAAKRASGAETGTVERIEPLTAQLVVRRSSDAPGCGMVVNYEDAELHPEAVS